MGDHIAPFTNPHTARFAALFKGLDRSYGTGKGSWVHEPVTFGHYAEHLAGRGPGLGIAPLKDDGRVHFAAIDLDMPDFEAADTMAGLLPGKAWVEKSRSGNAHVWVFFGDPDGIEAWVPRGILREATAAIGLPKVEVFPKQDRLRAGMFGNYINLPYFGDERLIYENWHGKTNLDYPLDLAAFVSQAEETLNDADDWRKRARWLGIPSPDEREGRREGLPHGEQPYLHMCAEHVIENRDSNPVVEGHRAVVYFCLAKQFANCSMYDSDEALQMMALVNDASPDPISESELRRIYFNAERGQFTSTGCDDPLFAPYAHPDCPIARR
jgi:hypothetical protein